MKFIFLFNSFDLKASLKTEQIEQRCYNTQ